MHGKPYISEDIRVDSLQVNGKEILVSSHAIKRARERGIAFPDQVYTTLLCGKVQRFGKRGIKFIKKSANGSIICLGEILTQKIIIKTIERGN